MRRPMLAAMMLLTFLGTPVLAQSPADHGAHHPDQKDAPAASPATPPEAPRGSAPSQGKMGGGMMNMMGGNMGGMELIDHVEGRIAFLRTELKITDAQALAWTGFADALRANAKALGEFRTSMPSQAGSGSEPLVDRLTWQEKWLTVRLEATRAMKSAMTNLVGTLSDEQKKAADELLAPHMGMMSMMQGRMGAMPMQGK